VIGLSGWQTFSQLFADSTGLIYGVSNSGELLRYRDHTRDGTGDVNSPTVIGDGFADYRFMFSGGEGLIFGVDENGTLRVILDQGSGAVTVSPGIGDGWGDHLFLFSGGTAGRPQSVGGFVEPDVELADGPVDVLGVYGIIYAVDTSGRLLFYRDPNRDGTGQIDVGSGSVIGLGGWQQMTFVFGGKSGDIYAVPSGLVST
jgi:hypothetical protein